MEKLLVSFTTVKELKELLENLDDDQKIYAFSLCPYWKEVIDYVSLYDVCDCLEKMIKYFNIEVKEYDDKEKYIYIR